VAGGLACGGGAGGGWLGGDSAAIARVISDASAPPSAMGSNLPSRSAMNIALCCCFIISRMTSAIRSLPMYSA
jgi:hypothetical protein